MSNGRGSLTAFARRTPTNLHLLASLAALSFVLFLVHESARDVAWLSRLHERAHNVTATLSSKSRPWSITTKFPWSIHEPNWRYNYTSLSNLSAQTALRDRANIGKCTSLYGSYGRGYYKALDTHVEHNQLHRYPAYVLDRSIVDGLWSKQAALLEVFFFELSKPAKDRLQWLAWFDADTMILNRQIPLETFLPPADMPHIHFVMTKDWNGLNDGVFYLRVSSWSVELLAATLAYRTFKPDEELQWSEQSAMQNVLREKDFASGAVYVPPRWFNAYPSGGDEEFSYTVRRGDMALHFAGVGEKENAMQEWMSALEVNRTTWEIPLVETNLTKEVEWFWEGVRIRPNGN